MHISIEHHRDQFNVALSSAAGKEAFLVIKGCRVKDSDRGRFVSWPARKLDSGKWWNHVYASEGFVSAVLKAYDEQQPPAQSQRTHGEMKRGRDDAARARQTRDDMDDIPF